MSNGVDFAGNGSEDAGSGPSSTGQPEKASRGSMGPIDLAGDGAADVGGTIDCYTEKSTPPKGTDISWAGDVGGQ